MCDHPFCSSTGPTAGCDDCGKQFCVDHFMPAHHACPGRASSSVLLPFGPPSLPPPVETVTPVPFSSTLGTSITPVLQPTHEIEKLDESDSEEGGILPLGIMPKVSTPTLTLLSLDTLEKESSELPSDSKSLLATCYELPSSGKITINLSVFHATDVPPPESLTWLAWDYSATGHARDAPPLLDETPPRVGTSYCYLSNEFVHQVELVIRGPKGLSLKLVAHALDSGRLLYLTGLHDERQVELLREAISSGEYEALLQLGAQVFDLFPHLLWMMFCPAFDDANTSRPIETVRQKIRESFTLERPLGEDTPDPLVKVELHRGVAQHGFTPCILTCESYEEGEELVLGVQLELPRLDLPTRLRLLTTLMAADLSRLAFPELGTETRRQCQRNVQVCFEDYFPIGHGNLHVQRLLVAGRSATRTSAPAFAIAMQELIRPWITTANNWHEPCEAEETQPFQWALARALGKITEDHPLASPMYYLRGLKKDDLIRSSARLKCQLILQAGIGHCREFSEVSFYLICELARRSRNISSLVLNVLRVEYEDQDHAFVVGGLDVRALADAEIEDDGETLKMWDIATDLVMTRNRGWVCDPYLERLDSRSTAWGKHVAYLHDKRAENEESLSGSDLKLEDVEPSDLELLVGDETRFLLIREQFARPCLYVVVSVDWEGTNLHPINLGTFEKHHSRFPKVKLSHFICPQYLCDVEIEPMIHGELFDTTPRDWSLAAQVPKLEAVAESIHGAIGKQDEVGLHIHGWGKLVSGAGVTPKHGGLDLAVVSRWGDTGKSDYLLGYSSSELRKIVTFALGRFRALGFGAPTSFRAGGWVGRRELLTEVRRLGISVDSSAIPASYIPTVSGEDTGLAEGLVGCWASSPDRPQPYRIALEDGEPLYEIPNGCALADYVSADKMLEELELLRAAVKAGHRQLFHIGFHQESCSGNYFNVFPPRESSEQPLQFWEELQDYEYYSRIKQVLEALEKITDIEVRYVTVTEAARIFLGHP